MSEPKRHYCKVCRKRTAHFVQAYYDGTVVIVCLVCGYKELVRRGYDYRRYERIINNEKYKRQLFPPRAFG